MEYTCPVCSTSGITSTVCPTCNTNIYQLLDMTFRGGEVQYSPELGMWKGFADGRYLFSQNGEWVEGNPQIWAVRESVDRFTYTLDGKAPKSVPVDAPSRVLATSAMPYHGWHEFYYRLPDTWGALDNLERVGERTYKCVICDSLVVIPVGDHPAGHACPNCEMPIFGDVDTESVTYFHPGFDSDGVFDRSSFYAVTVRPVGNSTWEIEKGLYAVYEPHNSAELARLAGHDTPEAILQYVLHRSYERGPLNGTQGFETTDPKEVLPFTQIHVPNSLDGLLTL